MLVVLMWDNATKKMTLANTGRTTVALWGLKFYDEPISINADARTVAASANYTMNGEKIYDELAARIPKGSAQLVPLDLFLKNERGEEFVQHVFLGTSWPKDTLSLGTQMGSVEPTHWKTTEKITSK
jgi:hypothetical protein